MWPLVPKANPLAMGFEILNILTILAPSAEITTAFKKLILAMGFEILNILTILAPSAEITTAFKITAKEVNSFTPPIPSDTGKAIAVVAEVALML